MSGLNEMTAVEMAKAIAAGETTSEELVASCLERISRREPVVGAWAWLDPEYSLEQAREADRLRRSGRPVGPLHGVPVGIKDIFDTGDMPTEDGTVLHAGRTPSHDATAVALLREAGAIIMGKTVTAELAVYTPGRTVNPRDPSRTPGGSSSGSAAAVADHMVPLAIGTQTSGSIIRPASYCGIHGFKPTFGRISRYRVLEVSRRLDHVGVFANSLGDIALIADVLMRYDARDTDMRPRPAPHLQGLVAQAPPVTPRLAFVKTPMWECAAEDVHGAFEELANFLGERVQEVALPKPFGEGEAMLRTIMESDLALSFEREYRVGGERMSAPLREMVERGGEYRATEYNDAVRKSARLHAYLEEIIDEYDAIVTPAATGEAPVGLGSTGDPIFSTLWSLCGVPSVTLPLMEVASGLPLGVQLVSTRDDDGRLLRTARWLEQTVLAGTDRAGGMNAEGNDCRESPASSTK